MLAQPAFSSEAADYAMAFVAEVTLDLHAFTHAPAYLELNRDAAEDGWLEGHARSMLFRVCDRLVDGGIFAGVPTSVPAIVAFVLRDEPRVTVCRLLLG